MTTPILKFDASQEHQVEAVAAIVGLFEGLVSRDNTEFSLHSEGFEPIPANLASAIELDWQGLQENFQRVCTSTGLPPAPLVKSAALELEGAGNGVWEYPSFTVEMETGTGKTYVYLRAIHELYQKYGFRKFVIVTPSIAIYEGVVKSIAITRDHFGSLYGNNQIGVTKYDGAALSRLRQFAMGTGCEILIITLDSFNQAAGRRKNNLYKPTEKLQGERLPYQYIQETRPILILDEPQNMESAKARQALATLHPLLALRFSATHRTQPNLIYRLSPFDAFKRNLVKRIEVYGCTPGEDFEQPLIKLQTISAGGAFTATMTVLALVHGIVTPRTITVRLGENLHDRVARPEFSGGFIVDHIDRAAQAVRFANGLTLRIGDELGESRARLFRVQIRETIQRHLERQKALMARRIKVLSLFFVDRVANYINDDGILRVIFDEEWSKLSPHYPDARGLAAESVRIAYFAEMKTRGGTIAAADLRLEEEEQNADERDAARAAFALIMRDKERLLSFDEPKAFIFAHSALREGWDNPNVFQICTLNESRSEMRKRQEIGRGLRLCVDQSGQRVVDEGVNELLVVANESYRSYASGLQAEYRTDGLAEESPPQPTDAKRAWAQRNETVRRLPEFKLFWDRLASHADPLINIDRDSLIAEAIERVSRAGVATPRIIVQKGKFIQYRYDVELRGVASQRASFNVVRESSLGETGSWLVTLRQGESLGEAIADQRLEPIRLEKIQGQTASIGDRKCEVGTKVEFELADEIPDRELAVEARTGRSTIPNVIERTRSETGLTGETIYAIFRGLPTKSQRHLLSNPEGFANTFLAEVRGAVADHVADRIAFVLGSQRAIDLGRLFPEKVKFAQYELVEAGSSGLYDRVQKDSDVEENFIARLRGDPMVKCFFKFPPSFKIHMPKILGNYNPDWGVVRVDESGQDTLYLVRETKGTDELEKLRFPHEQRKIKAAYRFFDTIGADYRVITDQTVDWWAKQHLDDQLRMLH